MKKKKNETNSEILDNEDIEMMDEAINVSEGDEQTIALEKRIEELGTERDEYLGIAQRVQADLENYRRRNASLRTDSIHDGRAEVFIELFPVIDNFERALEQAHELETDKSFVEGMDMIYRQLLGVLEKHNIEPIEGIGEPLDPMAQQAVLQEPCDNIESGCVMEILQKGYRVKDGKILRYSMVKVAE